MRLEEKVNSTFYLNDLKSFNDLFDPEKIEADHTFWGTRTVRLHGFEGTVSIESLVEKMHVILTRVLSENSFSASERISGKFLMNRLCELYRESTEKMSFVSRIIAGIRDWYKYDHIMSDITRLPEWRLRSGKFLRYTQESISKDFSFEPKISGTISGGDVEVRELDVRFLLLNDPDGLENIKKMLIEKFGDFKKTVLESFQERVRGNKGLQMPNIEVDYSVFLEEITGFDLHNRTHWNLLQGTLASIYLDLRKDLRQIGWKLYDVAGGLAKNKDFVCFSNF